MAIQLPYPDMVFVPLDVLTADEMNHIVANYTYLAETLDTSTEDFSEELAELQTGKLDKVTTTSTYRQLYAKNSDGTQRMMDIVGDAIANTIAQRGANGVIRVGTPAANADAANKKYVDDIVGNIETILNSINSGNGGGV